MGRKFINRYQSFCRCLGNLEKSLTADPSDDFVTEYYRLFMELKEKLAKYYSGGCNQMDSFDSGLKQK